MPTIIWAPNKIAYGTTQEYKVSKGDTIIIHGISANELQLVLVNNDPAKAHFELSQLYVASKLLKLNLNLPQLSLQDLGQLHFVFDDGSQILLATNGVALNGNSANNLILADSGGQKIFGSSGNERIVGGTGKDEIHGGTGNDQITAGKDSVVDGGDGNDSITGGSVIHGGTGDDSIFMPFFTSLTSSTSLDTGYSTQIFGDDGNDAISGGTRADELFGGAGNDYIDGNGGNDRIYGNEGNDRLFATSRTNEQSELDGGDGDDRIVGGDGNDKLLGGQGSDQLRGGRGSDTLNGGAGDDILIGSSGKLSFGDDGDDLFYGGDGNDVIDAATGRDMIDGGADYDILIFDTSHQTSTVDRQTDGWHIRDMAGHLGDKVVTNVEAIYFKDEAISFDTAGSAGQIFRLYQATFNRAPDKEGLGYWIKDMEFNHNSLTQIAQSFMLTPEFVTRYGNNASIDKHLTGFYQNILGRAPDSAGFTYWKDQISSGKMSVAGVLSSFAESPENQKLTAPATENGISFIPSGFKTGTTGNDILVGSQFDDELRGLEGNDILFAGHGHNVLDGGAGIDSVVYLDPRSYPEYLNANFDIEAHTEFTATLGTVNKNPNHSRIQKTNDGFVIVNDANHKDTDTLINIERVVFDVGGDTYFSHVIALDIDGNAGQVYRLMHAAFGNKVDTTFYGDQTLSGMISKKDAGESLQSIANELIKSPTFSHNFNDNLSIDNLLNGFYSQILGRTPDQEGFTYWRTQVENGKMTVADVLVEFSKSAEYQVKIIGSIQDGIYYDAPFVTGLPMYQ